MLKREVKIGARTTHFSGYYKTSSDTARGDQRNALTHKGSGRKRRNAEDFLT